MLEYARRLIPKCSNSPTPIGNGSITRAWAGCRVIDALVPQGRERGHSMLCSTHLRHLVSLGLDADQFGHGRSIRSGWAIPRSERADLVECTENCHDGSDAVARRNESPSRTGFCHYSVQKSWCGALDTNRRSLVRRTLHDWSYTGLQRTANRPTVDHPRKHKPAQQNTGRRAIPLAFRLPRRSVSSSTLGGVPPSG